MKGLSTGEITPEMYEGKQLYGVATDSPLGAGEICLVEDWRVNDEGCFEMKVNGSWYDSHNVFFIENNEIVLVYRD